MQGMIGVDVRILEGSHKVCQRLLFSPIHRRARKALCGQHTEKELLVRHGPDAESNGASLFNGILNAHLREEYLLRVPHDLGDCAPAAFVMSAVTGQ